MAMTIPFLDLVKRAKEKFEGRHRPTGPAPLPSVENKPESDKLAKRVMPYAVRTMTPEPTAPALAAASVIAARRIPATRPPGGTLGDLGPSAGVSAEPCGERTLPIEPSASKPAATQPAPASPPIQPPPAVRPPVAPATSRTIPPPRVGTIASQDGSTSRIVTPGAPAEDKPEKSLLIGTGGSAF